MPKTNETIDFTRVKKEGQSFVRLSAEDQRAFAAATFSTVDLAEDKIRLIEATRMNPRHDHLNAMLDPK